MNTFLTNEQFKSELAAITRKHFRKHMKSTKPDAQYSPKSDNPKTKCSGCRHFERPDGCEKVQGRISPMGWCKFFQAASKVRFGK